MLGKWMVRTIALLVLAGSLAYAQLPTAAISGQVKDSSGAAIPGATITASNRETGLTRTTTSSADGRFKLAGLPVGAYSVKAEAPAFKSEIQEGLTLAVAQEAVINFAMSVGAVQETVTVAATAPLVETTSGSLGGLVSEQQISELLLNGRNFNDLVLLQTGITVHHPTSTTSTVATGLAFSSNGAPVRSNFLMMDGASMVAGGGVTGVSVSGSMLGIEGIREFRVITNSFPAEYGMTMGSQTTIVSKGGTNEFHGSLFEFLRNSALDSRNFFDRKIHTNDPRIPAFRRNNFGAAVGGPVRKDKAFFFLTYEGVRESYGLTQVLAVPTAAARLNGGLGGVAVVNPVVRPYLDLFPLPTEPLPNDPNGIGGVGRFTYVFNRPTREEFGQARVDYNFSERDSSFIRYTIDDTSRTNPIGYPQFADFATSRGQFVTLAENHTFTPTVLNMFRLSFSRTFQNYDSPSDPSLGFLPGLQMGGIGPGSGITALSASLQRPLTLNQNLYTLGNDVLWSHGSHSFKFGTLLNRYHVFTQANTNLRGNYAFASLGQFLVGTPRQLTILTPGSITDRTYRWNTFGFYLQDDWKALPTLTLNLGLRYEFHTTINETSKHGASVRDILHDAKPTIGSPLFEDPSYRNFSPRIGFAWDVFGNASTSVRGGFGLLYDLANLSGAAQINATATPPFSGNNVLTTNVAFPHPVIPPGAAGRSLRLVDFHIQQAHLLQYNLTVERQLPGSMAVSVAYAGSRGINLIQTKEGNPTYPSAKINGRDFWTGSEERLNPNWDDVEFKTAGGDSWYNSLQLSVQKRLSRGLQFNSNYTWSRVLDTTQGQHGGEAGGASITGTDPNHSRTDKGPADFDTRHSWTFSTLYRIPAPAAAHFGKLLDGWRLGTILSLKSGLPFTPVLSGNRSRSKVAGTAPDHPDLISGRKPSDIILGGPDKYFDPAAFAIQPVGFLGTSSRNFLQGPSLVEWDFSLTKDTALSFLGEGRRLEFRAELFNLLNHPSFNIPVGGRTVYTADETRAVTTPLTTVGQIDRTINSARQIQFALKLVF